MTLGTAWSVLGQAHRDPAVSVRLRSAAGAALDPKGKEGLAYLTGRMLLRGSAGRTFAEINDITDGLGASIGVGPGRTSTDISIKCLAEDLPQMLDLAAAALRSPDFPTMSWRRSARKRSGRSRIRPTAPARCRSAPCANCWFPRDTPAATW